MSSVIRILVLGSFFLVLGFFLSRVFEQPGVVVIGSRELSSFSWPSDLNFAGDRVPVDDFYVREAWERDFLILADSPYQSLLYLKRAAKYFPLIESEIAERDFPEDLKYVAVAESAFIEDSTSSAGARGIWQFMPATARQYGLTVDEFVDERLHFEKATRAALDYFEFLYGTLENWTLSAASYNAGHNRILGHLIDQQVMTYYDLYMNSETSRYLFRILAIKTIMENPNQYGLVLRDADYFSWPDYYTVKVSRIENLSDWAVENGTSLRMIKELNPWILRNELPEGEWRVKVPR